MCFLIVFVCSTGFVAFVEGRWYLPNFCAIKFEKSRKFNPSFDEKLKR